MRKLLLVLAVSTAATPAFSGDLSARITYYGERSRSGFDWFEALLVVENRTERTFRRTEWSCQHYNSKGEPVGEDSFSVYNVEPNKQTAKNVHGHAFSAVATTQCRLTDES